MLFDLKALASVLLLSTAILGAAVESLEHLEKRAQPKGVDVSSNQGSINWKTVADKGISFAYIKATEGTGNGSGTPITWNAEIPFQPTRTPASPPSILAPPMPASFAVVTTLLSPIGPLVLHRPNISSPTVEDGVTMGRPSQVPSTSNVRSYIFNSLDPST